MTTPTTAEKVGNVLREFSEMAVGSAEHAMASELVTARATIARLEASNRDVEAAAHTYRKSADAAERRVALAIAMANALDALFSPSHVDGCLYKADQRMPCQCGSTDRQNTAVAAAKSALQDFRASALAAASGAADGAATTEG